MVSVPTRRPIGSAGEQVIENVEADVPACGAHGDEIPVDGGREREARADLGWVRVPSASGWRPTCTRENVEPSARMILVSVM